MIQAFFLGDVVGVGIVLNVPIQEVVLGEDDLTLETELEGKVIARHRVGCREAEPDVVVVDLLHFCRFVSGRPELSLHAHLGGEFVGSAAHHGRRT